MHATGSQHCIADHRSVAEIRDRHAEMYWALSDELFAAHTRPPSDPIVLPEGAFRLTSGFLHLYDFCLPSPVAHLRSGQDVLGTFGDVHITCTIVEAEGANICVALPRRLGSRIATGGTLTSDTAFINEALLRRLTAGIRGSTLGEPCHPPFNGDAALRIIGAGTFTPAQRLPSPDVFQRGVPLNPAQVHAVRLAFGSNACFLFGPPGTGKTLTLARVVEAHVRAGRSVLMLGPTNRAVDLLMLAVAERLRAHPSYIDGKVLRYGGRPDMKLLEGHSDFVCLDQVVDRIRSESYAPAMARLDQRRDSWQSGLDETRNRAQRRAVERASILLPRRLLERCDVLATTVHQTYLSPAIRRQFDVVVIDEASMVSALQVYVAAGLAKSPHGRVVVSGDYQQLPPIVHAHTDRARLWLGSDVFHLVGIPDDIAREDDPPYVSILDVQHRMSPGIGDLISRLFYSDRLTTARSVRGRAGLPAPLGNGDVFFVDTSRSHPMVRRSGGSSRENPLHVQVVEDLLAELDSGGVIRESPGLQVAVISPFRGQARALSERFSERYRGRGVEVTTSHRGQGGEAEVVILDLTDAPGLPVSGFLGARGYSEAGARLLNVAMSRARQQLYVVGAMDYLGRAGGRIVRDLIHQLRESGLPVEVRQIHGSAAQVYGSNGPSRVA